MAKQTYLSLSYINRVSYLTETYNKPYACTLLLLYII